MSRDNAGRTHACASRLLCNERRLGRKLAAFLILFILAAGCYAPSAFADRNFAVRYHTDDNGAITLIGNTLLSCVQGTQSPPATCISTVPVSGTGATGANLNDNNYNMAYVNTVGGTGIFNSSTATLTRPAGASVLWAGLYWSGETVAATGGSAPPNAAIKNQIRFSTPASAGFQTITANQLDTTAGIGGNGSGFNGFADVTTLVQAGGTGVYAVANLQAATGQNRYGGWALIVVFRNTALPLRDLTVFDGYLEVSTATISATVSGFRTPATGAFSTAVGAVAFDGDLGSTGDAMRLNGVALSDATNPANNFYNSTISIFGVNFAARNPNFVDTLGVDADLINTSGILPNSATSATVDFVASSGDTYFPDVLTFSTDVFQPDFTSTNGFTKTVADLNGGSTLPGDILEYTLTMTNTGNDLATGVVLTDAIPANTTYVPGSMAVVTGANTGAKTDAAGDDQANYTGTSVVFRLGTGANATTGGAMLPSASTSVRFRVQVNAGTPANTVISNQGALHYIGATLGTPFDTTSDGDPTTPGAQPTTVTTAVPASATLSLSKVGTPDPVVPGNQLTYTLTVTNSGPSPAASTVVTDATPANTTFASASAPAGWTITTPAVGATGTVQFSNASLAVGTYTLTLVVNVNAAAPAPGTISNTATVASPTDVNGDVTSTSTNTTPAQNLTITKNGPGSVGQNQDIAYSITVNNPGPLNASTVTVTDPTPTNTTFVSANVPPGWTITSPVVGGTGTIVFANASLPPGTYTLNVTLHVTTGAAVGGTLTNTATLASPSDSNNADNVATSAATVRNPVPTVVKSFTPASVRIAGDSTLSLVITNNAGVALTALALSDPLPTPVVVSPTPAATNSCGGTLSATAGSATVALTGGTLAAGPGTTCTITVNVRSATAGTFVNTTGNVSSTQTGAGTGASATLDVAALLSAPVTKTFVPASVGAGGTSVMTIAFTNPNAAAVTGVAFTDNYPTGLANVASGIVVAGNTCGGTLTAANGGTSTVLTGGSIPVGGCTIRINVTAALAGTYVNSTGTITEGNAVDNPGASGTLTTTTLSAPTATKAFSPATVQLGATSQMTITLTNPNTIAIGNAAFNDTYPAGIQNAATGALVSNTCGGAVSVPADGTSAAFAGGTIPASGSCAIVVNVVATAIGAQLNSTGPITSNNAASGASASGTLTVTALTAPTTSKSFAPATVDVGDAAQMTISIANPNALALTGVAFTDNYPSGLANAAAGVVASSTCGGTVTANGGGTSTALVGGTVPANGSCAIVINVVATAPGVLVNSTGPVTSANGTSGAAGSGTLTVNPSANLAVVKTGPASVGFGGAISYTIVVSNAGPSAANGASFSDPVPAGVTGITANCTPGGGAACGAVNVAGNNVTSTITTLPSGSSVTFTISGTAPTSGASIANTATIAPPSGTTDPNGTNNSSTLTTTLTPPQLTTTKTATPNPFVVGQPARYDITVHNTGAGVTTAPVVIADTLAPGLTLASASGTGWNCVGTTALTCTFSGTLAAGASTTLTLNVNVSAAAIAANNTATTSGGGDPSCPAAAHCVGTVVVPVSASADIVVDKTVDNAVPNVGETITFTIGATNLGPSNATNVRVTDALPSGLAFVSAAPSQGTYDSSTGNWNIGTLTDGSGATLDIVASVLTPGTLTNIATRTGGDQLDPDPSNNSAQASVNAQPTADLQVGKTVNNAVPNLGTNVVYTITLTNAGPDDATGVAIVDALPAGLVFVSSTPSQGSYNPATGRWTVGALANGDAATLAITATVTLPGDITNTASVSASNEFDPNTANNSGGVTLNGQSADIQIVKTVNDANPVVGDSVTFTITATNNGPSGATGVAITDALPAELTFVSATASHGTYNSTTGVWTLGSLSATGAGSSATLTIVALVADDGGFTNTAAVSANDQPDPNPANNSSSVVVTPIASADLSVVKTGPASVIAGQQVAYTLAVTNDGPSSAANVVLDDPTPAGLVFVSASAPCAGGFPCDLGTLAAGAVVNVVATFGVPSAATGAISNTATVSSDTLDTNGANNSSTFGTSIARQGNIHVVKTGPASVTAGGAISYSVVVTNNGPSDANGTTFGDTVPAAIVGVTAACGTQTGGAVCGAVGVAGNTVTSTITTLPAGGSVTFTINGTAPDDGGSLGNTASATPPGGVTDPDPSDNSSTVTTTVNASADVSVVKTGPAAAAPGTNVTYTIAVHNAGPSMATAVQVADPTPPGLVFVSSTPCAGFPCALGDIASGGDVTITATYAIPANYAGAAIANTASVSSATADPDPGDNSSTATTPIAAVADIVVAKSGPASVLAGATITYTVVVSNAGPGDASGVQFSDPVPSAISAVGATCSASGGGAVCGSVAVASNVVASTVALLPVGGSVTFTITGVAPNDAQSLTNTASAAPPAGFGDPNPGNNSSSATTSVGAQADVSIVKSGPASVASGAAITYTLRISNAGPSAADGTSYSDVLPAGINGVVASCGSETGGAVCAAPTVAGNTVTGSVPTLPSGGAITVTIDGIAPIGATTLTNTGTLTLPANVADPDPANNTSTVETVIGSAADIALGKTVDNAAPNVGDTVTFTITATNLGPDDATGIGVVDGLPFGFGFVSATPSQGTYVAATGLWTVGDLADGAGATLTIVATVAEPGALVNTATVVASDQTDPDTSNNNAGASLNAGASADLAIAKSVDSATPNVGDTVTFTITLGNNGPDDSSGAEVTDVLPAGLTLISASASQGVYDDASGIWTVGAIADGASATLTIAASVDVAGAITNIATITGENENDPAQGNNQSGASVNGQLADIGVSKTVDNANPNVGDTVMFTVTAHNGGPDASTGVVVTDNLPAGLALVSATPSQGTFAGGTWTIGALDAAGAGATATLTIAATVQQAGAITNTAGVTASDQTDPNATNDSASASLNGNPLADLAIVKNGPASAAAGDTLVYTIVVTNDGPSDAANVVVDDAIPAGTTFAGNSGACSTPYPCAIGTLASGASATITTSVLVPADYSGAPSVVNIASVSSDTPDPDNTNNQGSAATAITTAGASADLAIVKSAPASVATGASITYTLAISNLGPDAADGASYDDTLPAGITVTAASCGDESGGATCGAQPSVGGGHVAGTLAALPAGGAAVITIVATAPDTATTLSNSATIAPPADVSDPNPANDTSSVDTAVTAGPQSADVSIVKVGPASASAGGNVSYKLEVDNNGPDDAMNVVVDDPAPVGLTFVSASPPCAAGFPCTLGTLANGAGTFVTVTFAIDASVTGSVTNTATVSSDTPDPVVANNSGEAVTPIIVGATAADLIVAKTGPASVMAGGSVTYQVTVANIGPDAAENVVLADPTPPGLTLVAADAPCAAGFPCALGTLAAGANATIDITYAVAVDAGGTTVANTAAATSDTTDPDGDNNASTVTTAILPIAVASADLVVRKTGPVSVDIGSVVAYTIVVSNAGPDAAVNARLDDPAPPGLSLVDASAPCAGGFPCALGTLANGGSVSITAHFVVGAGTASPIINTATASSDTSDPNGANSSSSAVTTVIVGASPPVEPVPAGGRWSVLLAGLLLIGAGIAWRVRQRRD